MSWPTFEAFLASRGDDAGTRITFLDGVLEIMSPSGHHELLKKSIARLLELWAFEFDVAVTGGGSFTILRADSEAGVEPDECYYLGAARDGLPPSEEEPPAPGFGPRAACELRVAR